MMDMIQNNTLSPEKLIPETISLETSAKMLANFDDYKQTGITVITDFN